MMLVVLFRNLLSKHSYNSDIQQQKRQQNKHTYYLKTCAAYSYICGGVFEQLARYTLRYQESDLRLAFILLNLLTLPLFH